MAHGILFSALDESRPVLRPDDGWSWSALTQEAIIEASQFDTVGIDFSAFDFRTRQSMEEDLIESMVEHGSPVVTLEHRSNPYETVPRFLADLNARFPRFENGPRLSADLLAVNQFAAILARLEEIVKRTRYSETEPIYVFVRGFIPYSERYDQISSFIKELHDLRFRKRSPNTWARAVRVIVSAATPMERWAAANVGMVGGREIRIKAPRAK